MNTFQTLSSELQKYGLTTNQVEVYIALVKHGELRIQSIADIVKIPRTSVYESLDGLLELGLIEKIIDHKFIRIKAYPISSLRNTLEEKVVQIEELKHNLASLEHAFELLPVENAPQSAILRYYKGISGGRQLFYNTLSSTDTVYVYSSYGRSKFVGKTFYKNFVQQSQEKRIKEKVLINPTESALRFIKADTGSDLARTRLEDIRVLPEEKFPIKGETFIYNNVFAQIDLKVEEINGFEVEDSGFVKMQRAIFETLWEHAQPILTNH